VIALDNAFTTPPLAAGFDACLTGFATAFTVVFGEDFFQTL
jgi:hypothetical protein